MKIIRRGMTFFEVRVRHKSDHPNLPVVYASFIRNYVASRQKPMIGEEVMHPVYGEKITVARVVYLDNPEHVTLGALFSIEESKEITDRSEDLRNLSEEGYLLIAEDASGHSSFLVGTDNPKSDKIYIYSPNLLFPGGSLITEISSDIYSFINGFALVELDEGIGYEIKCYESLYRNWREDFWRVRDEE